MNIRSNTPSAPFALSALALALAALSPAARAAAPVPPNLSASLGQLVAKQAADRGLDPAARQARDAREARDSGMLVTTDAALLGDADGRVLVNVLVDGMSSYDKVRAAVEALPQVQIKAEDRKYRGGIIEALVPVDTLTALARLRGVSTVQGVMRPVTNVGSVTQQAVVQHRVDKLTQDGTGITIGVLSDSYNTAANFFTGGTLTIRAAQDIASGDLPGTGNPVGNTQPVVVLDEFGTFPNTGAIDEGRAMLQLIHDIAPKARLGYASAFNGEVSFANNIRALGGVQGLPTSNPNFAAQIVVDDVQYFSEGMFADTIIAQAVDDVTALGVSYFSSAGNTPPTQGYASDFRLVPVGAGATAGTNINLAAAPAALYAGGFHNFRSDGGQDIAQTIQLGAVNAQGRGTLDMMFQWDDPYDQTPTTVGEQVLQSSGAVTGAQPAADFALNNSAAGQQYRIAVTSPNDVFDAIVTVIQPDGTTLLVQDSGNSETFNIFLPQVGAHTIRVTGFQGATGSFDIVINKTSGQLGITTNFNLLFFNSTTGAYLGTASEDNLASNRPLERASLSFPVGQTSVQFVIARANTPTAPIPAKRLRYKMINAAYPAEYFSYTTPITYGHNSAAGSNGVAAYSPFPPNIPEDFTSTGPVRIVFDRNNNRIPDAQQIRQKPTMAAMDGGNTTFFTADTARDADLFPNFFGTSAAAPTAAAIAALVLQKNGGPGSVTPPQMRSILQKSAFPHDLDPYASRGQATATNGGKVTVTIEGDNSITSQRDPNAMALSYTGPSSIASITFNGTTGNPGGGSETNPNLPGLVFDSRNNGGDMVSGGFPFTFGSRSVGLVPANVTASYLDQAPPPAVAGQFFGLKLDFTPGAFTGGKALRFGVDRDEFTSAFPATPTRNGSSADLGGAAVRIPAGTLAAGGITFTGTLVDGSTFSGTIANRIGAGYSGLDGFGFINAENAVSQPLP